MRSLESELRTPVQERDDVFYAETNNRHSTSSVTSNRDMTCITLYTKCTLLKSVGQLVSDKLLYIHNALEVVDMVAIVLKYCYFISTF